MKSILTTTILLLTLALASVNTVYANGGYTYNNDGYWYDTNGCAYTRERYQCYYNRCNWYWAYRYIPCSVKQSVKKDWKQTILDITERREENTAFLDAIKALNPSADEVRAIASYLPAHQQRLLHYKKTYAEGFNADQGDTVFSVSQLSDIYNSNDLSVLYQQSARLVESSQAIAGDAQAGFNDAIRAEGRERARIAEIIAKTSLVREALRAATPPHAETVEGTISEGEVNTLESQQFEDVHAVIAAKCIKCHNDIKPSGGFDLQQYDRFSETQKRRVVLAITSGRMPKGGKPLVMTEISLFVK